MAVSDLDQLISQGIRGRRVFVRSDLNVPISDGVVGDDSRVRASVPTLARLAGAGARVIVASHLGRPKGERRPDLSLRPVAARLAAISGLGVGFCDASVGDRVATRVADLEDGQLLMIENLRFAPGETDNDPDFARALADLADDYVNDAFGTAHRAHASTAGMVAHMDRAVAGELLRREIAHLEVVRDPERPLLVILGGAKVSDKLGVLEALAPHADVLAIGGAMAYTFLAARGEATGDSLVEPERIPDARRVLDAAAAAGRRLLLPRDHVVTRALDPNAEIRVGPEIPDGFMGADIGPETAQDFAREAAMARTLFWNGPMGVFEIDAFAQGTRVVAQAVAKSEATSVVGGGDSLAAVHQLGVAERIGHCSTGGGASLEYIQGLRLPGIAALEH
jgi:phosphoglycerate kinase